MDTNKSRYFHFAYSYFADNHRGAGELSLSTNFGFPSKKAVKDHAIKAVCDEYPHSYDVTIIIIAWIEMTESDYNDWNEK